MTTITWKGGNGEFDDASHWNTGSVPGANDDAMLTATGTYTVTAYAPFEVSSLTIGAGATLDVAVEDQFINGANVDLGLANDGTLDVEANELFEIGVTTANSMTISNSNLINNYGDTTFLSDTTSITGGGNIYLGNGVISGNFTFIISQRAFDATIENVDNTIAGSGTFIEVNLQNDAGGSIIGNVTNHPLTLETGHQVVNMGLLEAASDGEENPGSLVIDDSVKNTGTIEATNGAVVNLDGAANTILNHDGATEGTLYATQGSTIVISQVVQGGEITTDEESDIYVTGGAFDGSSQQISLSADVEIADGSSLTLLGSISNVGLIDLPSGDLIASGIVALNGGGHIQIGDGGDFGSIGPGATLLNVDNTIQGAGELGDGRLVLTNQGLVNANQATPLLVSVAAGSVNSGVMEATVGGVLEFVRGSISNIGVIAAGNQINGGGDGSTVAFLNNTVANNAGGVLTGGTWEAYAGDSLSLSGGAVTTLAATIGLFGTGSQFEAGNGLAQTELEQSLMTIATGGRLILDQRDYDNVHTLTLNGTLQLGGSTFTSGLITGTAGSVLTGNGVVGSVVKDAGSVSPGIGTISFTAAGNTFSGALSSGKTSTLIFAAGSDYLEKGASMGPGNYGILAGATVVVAASVNCTGQVTEVGALIISKGKFDVTGVNSLTGAGSVFAGAVSGAGTLEFGGGVAAVDAGASLSVANLQLAGGVKVSVGETLTYAGAFSEAAKTSLTVGSSDHLTLSGSTSVSGVIELVSGSSASHTTFSGSSAFNGNGGTLELDAHATANLAAGVASGEVIAFKGTDAVLDLAAPALFGGSITGFATGDVLDLDEKIKAVSHTASTLTVTLANGGTQTFTLSGSYGALRIEKDGAGGNEIVGVSTAKAAHVISPIGDGDGSNGKVVGMVATHERHSGDGGSDKFAFHTLSDAIDFGTVGLSPTQHDAVDLSEMPGFAGAAMDQAFRSIGSGNLADHPDQLRIPSWDHHIIVPTDLCDEAHVDTSERSNLTAVDFLP